jgi:hypothetical protein
VRVRSLRPVAGIATALLCIELGLRVFATAMDAPRPRITADSLGGAVVERRQLQESVAASHFSAAGARLTGHAPARSGVNAVILGDSYVLAAQVTDRRTMGAQLETLARAEGIPLDVRQYAWSNATPAQYLFVADDISRRWNATRVFVVVSDNDMDWHTLSASGPWLRVDSLGAARVAGEAIDTIGPPPRHSVLMQLMRYRMHIVGLRMARAATFGRPKRVSQVVAGPAEPGPDSAEFARLPKAIVETLADAYGPRLTMIFLAVPGLSADSTRSMNERRFLAACAERGADCESTREAMVALHGAGRIAYGGSTTALGSGHLNNAGHHVMAELMWRHLRVQR